MLSDLVGSRAEGEGPSLQQKHERVRPSRGDLALPPLPLTAPLTAPLTPSLIIALVLCFSDTSPGGLGLGFRVQGLGFRVEG